MKDGWDVIGRVYETGILGGVKVYSGKVWEGFGIWSYFFRFLYWVYGEVREGEGKKGGLGLYCREWGRSGLGLISLRKVRLRVIWVIELGVFSI